MTALEQPPPSIVRWTRRLEDASALDVPVRALEPSIRALFGTGPRGSALRGEWLGHAIHPLLTDVVIGTWGSASLLDLLGARDSPGSAQRLVGIGLVAAGPTAWTGWAEWSAAGKRDQRVGLVHAVVNGLAIGVYTASWIARHRGRHGAGARLALAGAGVLGVGAYLVATWLRPEKWVATTRHTTTLRETTDAPSTPGSASRPSVRRTPGEPIPDMCEILPTAPSP